ncbi:unnamed protein product [Caenorhabditis auriculariae]|uniref:Uncharacterized protein n=1 Tax=Caenorhabditis auriculariae TaxID=2777116 RepID=A0A8S1H6S9_9PELO|nr:unnamed protein product [Caenorhabditis auriculariae]
MEEGQLLLKTLAEANQLYYEKSECLQNAEEEFQAIQELAVMERYSPLRREQLHQFRTNRDFCYNDTRLHLQQLRDARMRFKEFLARNPQLKSDYIYRSMERLEADYVAQRRVSTEATAQPEPERELVELRPGLEVRREPSVPLQLQQQVGENRQLENEDLVPHDDPNVGEEPATASNTENETDEPENRDEGSETRKWIRRGPNGRLESHCKNLVMSVEEALEQGRLLTEALMRVERNYRRSSQNVADLDRRVESATIVAVTTRLTSRRHRLRRIIIMRDACHDECLQLRREVTNALDSLNDFVSSHQHLGHDFLFGMLELRRPMVELDDDMEEAQVQPNPEDLEPEEPTLEAENIEADLDVSQQNDPQPHGEANQDVQPPHETDPSMTQSTTDVSTATGTAGFEFDFATSEDIIPASEVPDAIFEVTVVTSESAVNTYEEVNNTKSLDEAGDTNPAVGERMEVPEERGGLSDCENVAPPKGDPST